MKAQELEENMLEVTTVKQRRYLVVGTQIVEVYEDTTNWKISVTS